MKKKPINRKHKYSTIALFVFLVVAIIGSVVAIDSREVDILCAEDDNLLKRIDGRWVCYVEPPVVFGEYWGTNVTPEILTSGFYYNITDLQLGHSRNLQGNNSTFIIEEEGFYKITFTTSFSDGANSEYHFKLGVNGISDDHCYSRRKLGTGGDVGALAMDCIDNFTTNDEITIMVENDNNVNDPLLETVNFNIHYIGGLDE